MHLNRRTWIQLAVFVTVSVIALTVTAIGYLRLPALLFDAGRYRVTVELPESAGLYARGNVTYIGTEVGEVESVALSDNGVDAVLSLRKGTRIPADVKAEVHSQTAVGELFIGLVPTSGDGTRTLADGDVIPQSRASVPPDINSLLDATNRGLEAIPNDNLKTTIDEGSTAIGGLGAELSRIVRSSTTLAIDARDHIDDITNNIDNAAPILDTQIETSDAVTSWAASLADVTQQISVNDAAVRGILQNGPAVADEANALVDRLKPTLPVLLANLVSVGQVAVTYRDNLEQILVLLPQGAGAIQAIMVPNKNTKQDYKGAYLSFNLNLNLPPTCNTGFLPPQQQRGMSLQDYPDRPAGDLYCRVPQDGMFNVRGARNTPCVTRPGKRAPTVKMCESDESYIPLNDGYQWKGDPNATLSGQGVPQLPPGTPSVTATPPPEAIVDQSSGLPVTVAQYDPATGTYTGPDGKRYTQADLGNHSGGETWQSMLLPPQN